MAVGASRTLLTSVDGRTWTENGFLDAGVELYSAFPIGDRWLSAGSPRSIVASTGPFTWTEFLLPDSITNLYDLWVTFNGIYMVGTGGAAGTDGMVVRYRDPSNWTSFNLGPSLTPRSITSFGSGYIVVGDDGTILTSQDLATWTQQSAGVAADLLGIAQGLVPSNFVVVGDGGLILTSE